MTPVPLFKLLRLSVMASSEIFSSFVYDKSKAHVAPIMDETARNYRTLNWSNSLIFYAPVGYFPSLKCPNYSLIRFKVFNEQLKSIRVDLEESASHNFELDKVALEMYTLLWHGLTMLVENRRASGGAVKPVKVKNINYLAQHTSLTESSKKGGEKECWRCIQDDATQSLRRD